MVDKTSENKVGQTYKIFNSHNPPFVKQGLTFDQAKDYVDNSADWPICCRLKMELESTDSDLM